MENVAFFLKQWGGRTTKAGGRELDGRTWDEMPEPREPAFSCRSMSAWDASDSVRPKV
jgi:hypothetical protein